jgi:hypothetical protein
VTLSSAVAAVYLGWVVLSRGRQLVRAGAFRAWSGRLLFVPGIVAWLMFAANAALFGSPALYALALCIQMSVSVISFYQLIAAAAA